MGRLIDRPAGMLVERETARLRCDKWSDFTLVDG